MSDDAIAVRYGTAPPGPSIPWRRIALIHHAAGFLVGLLVPIFLFAGDISSLLLGLISGIATVVVAAFPPFIGALAGQRIAGRSRSLGRDLLGVGIGALAGGLPTTIIVAVAFGFGADTPWWFGAVVAVSSAIGFGIQVALAWRAAATTPASATTADTGSTDA